MIRRLMHRVTHLHMTSEFDSYIAGLQNEGGTGRPTVDEAKLDYWAVLRRQTLVN